MMLAGRKNKIMMLDGSSLDHRWIGGPTATDQPTLVLLHEGLGSIALWRDFPDRLAAATGLPLFAWSRLGHGFSGAMSRVRATDYLQVEAVALPAILAQAGIGKPILVGHSDGASIALIHAINAARDPGLVQPQAILLEAPHSFVEPVTLDGIQDALELKDQLVPRMAKHHNDAETLFHAWADTWLSPPFAHWDIRNQLAEITCPTLVIQGEGDEYGTPEQVHVITRSLTDAGNRVAEGVLLADCGHSPHRDQGDAVLQAMTDFLRRQGLLPGA